jgi:hypothetical protein
VHPRTRRLLVGTALALLAVACTAGFGASKAAAASQHATTKVKKISACGYVAHTAGTYELTKSITDSGSGTCISVTANNVTLYLDSHTITGTGTDACVVVAGGPNGNAVKDTVIGGTMPKPKTKPKASKPATLTNCETGLVFAVTSGATASNLNIVAPASSGAGAIVAESEGASLSHITVPLHAGNSAVGFILEEGADNAVMNSTVHYNGAHDGFEVEMETGDTFTHDTVDNPYGPGTGTGFFDSQSARSTYSHCTVSGQINGFDLNPEGNGPVTLTYDKATGSAAIGTSVGFKVTTAFQYADSASPFHTLVSHNKTIGFGAGFEDTNEGVPDTPVAEKWIDNTADNYSQAGFFITYPTDYTMTGNIADANTAGKKYTSGTSYGFLLTNAGPANPFASFSNNQAYDSEIGFLSAGAGVGGKGNIAKRNKVNSVGVEISG